MRASEQPERIGVMDVCRSHAFERGPLAIERSAVRHSLFALGYRRSNVVEPCAIHGSEAIQVEWPVPGIPVWKSLFEDAAELSLNADASVL